jgi:DNA topoisomerase-1
MENLRHNGVLVPPRYVGRGLTVKVRGETIKLSDEQEEMAVAWARKVGTPYVEDPEFAENFHRDFSEKLGVKVLPGDVDFSEVLRFVEEERERKASLPREERKRLREERKAEREANKERYGWATVDGVRMEIGNYTVEPSSIFMGRGEHPKRGMWKEGPRQEDIELNLSDASLPPGNWKGRVWESDSIWIARWRDKLSGKMKYVWPSDSSHLKQEKDIEKFDKAVELGDNLRRVRRHIVENLGHEDPRRRKTATVTFLIDHCKFRVGDEKDEDEAETIGASTLKPEHIGFNGDGTVTFDFLGKDSVRHHLCVEMPEQVISNLKEFSAGTESALFNGVNSQRVSEFLDEVMTGLSAKVFRTHYASTAVEERLKKERVGPDDPDYVKKHAATLANLEAAVVCNHRRTIPKTWERSLQNKKDRLEARKRKASQKEKKQRRRMREAEGKYRERLARYEKKLAEDQEKLKEYKRQLKEKQGQGKPVKGLKKSVSSKNKAVKAQRERMRRLKRAHAQGMEKMRRQLEAGKERERQVIERQRLQMDAYERTRDYNLGTSLKSYIDPRIYLDWGRRVGYDWRSYYPKTLERKFSWVEEGDDHSS